MPRKHISKVSSHNPARNIKHGTHGKCEFCKKVIKNLEAHMEKVHREKIDI